MTKYKDRGFKRTEEFKKICDEARDFYRKGVVIFAEKKGKTYYALEKDGCIGRKTLDQIQVSGNLTTDVLYRLGLAVGYSGAMDKVIAKVNKDMREVVKNGN